LQVVERVQPEISAVSKLLTVRRFINVRRFDRNQLGDRKCAANREQKYEHKRRMRSLSTECNDDCEESSQQSVANTVGQRPLVLLPSAAFLGPVINAMPIPKTAPARATPIQSCNPPMIIPRSD
jgi:hypothetical protein